MKFVKLVCILSILVGCTKDVVKPTEITINDTKLQTGYYSGKTSYELKIPVNGFTNIDSIRTILGINNSTESMGNNNLGFVYVDINGDALEDIFYTYQSLNPNQYVKPDLLLNMGNGKYKVDNSYLPSDYNGNLDTRKSCVGDFNNDGFADIVMGNTNFEGNGPPDKTKDVTALIMLSDKSKFKLVRLDMLGDVPHHAIACGDLNGDGNVDIIAGGGQDTTYLLFGNGSGSFTKKVFDSVNSAHLTFEIIDVDKDGKNDIVVGGEEYTPYSPTGMYNYTKILWNTGNGTFNRSTLLPIPTDKFSLVMDIASEDIDDDGIKEIFLNKTIGGNNADFYKGHKIIIYKTNDYKTYNQIETITSNITNQFGNPMWMTHMFVYKKNNQWSIHSRFANGKYVDWKYVNGKFGN